MGPGSYGKVFQSSSLLFCVFVFDIYVIYILKYVFSFFIVRLLVCLTLVMFILNLLHSKLARRIRMNGRYSLWTQITTL